MRLLRLASAYPAYLRAFYLARAELVQSLYTDQLAELHYDAFGWADFWDHALAPFGYEVRGIIANAEPLQRAWAKEHGVSFNHSRWEHDIAAAQIASYSPQVLFVEDFGRFSADWILDVRRRTPSIRLVVGWCGAPYSGYSAFRGFDVVFSNIPEVVRDLAASGFRAEHLNHGFEPRILDRLPKWTQPKLDFTFVGQVSDEPGAHLDRLRMLERLHDDVGIAIFCPREERILPLELKTWVARKTYFTSHWLMRHGVPRVMLEGIPIFGRATMWAQAPRKASLFKRRASKLIADFRPPVFGLEMFTLLRDSKVTFNAHIGLSKRSATNMRLFESTGVGACLVTDWKENLGDLFDLDREIVCYRSPEECAEKVRWLLSHTTERESIARAGQARTLRDHTFACRAPRFHELVKKYLR